MEHASFLTDVIVDLGGEPTTVPQAFEKPGNIKGMLELDLKMEMQDVENYAIRARQAEEPGENPYKFRAFRLPS
jgi:bacterioferritin (cytochrome b1)